MVSLMNVDVLPERVHSSDCWPSWPPQSTPSTFMRLCKFSSRLRREKQVIIIILKSKLRSTFWYKVNLRRHRLWSNESQKWNAVEFGRIRVLGISKIHSDYRNSWLLKTKSSKRASPRLKYTRLIFRKLLNKMSARRLQYMVRCIE